MTNEQGREVFSDELTIKFEGSNDIDVRQLFGYVLGIQEAYQANMSMQYHNPETQLKVVAINKGSFEIVLQSMVALAPDLITKVPQAITSFKEVMEMIKLKRELRGKKPTKVEKEGDIARVINIEGDVSFHDCNIVMNYMNNPKIDEGLTKAFGALNKGAETKHALSMTSAEETVRLEEQEYPNIATAIIGEPIDRDKLRITTIETELKIAKLDFIGDTMWSFVNREEKKITASIEDDDFRSKVRSGKTKLSANDWLQVRLRVEVEYDDFGDPKKKKYFIEQVHSTQNADDLKQMQISIDDLGK